MSLTRRLASGYHRVFHVAQLTIHDRWVKRLRLLAFLSASSIATQIVLRSALGYVGMENLLPTSILGILAASAIWLVAYPAMWFRMLAVVVEMEAKKEYAAIVHEIHKLHHPSAAHPADPESARESLLTETVRR